MSLISELQASIGAVASSVGPATVSIGRDHRGTGIVVAANRVLTNAHNLRDRTVQVSFGDGRVEQGTVVGADPARDLVVLEVNTADIAAPEWSDAAAGVGTVVVATARDGSGVRVTVGTVSQESRSFRGPGGRPITVALEHTAPLAPGSSGGPLTDTDGRLIAINTHRLGKGFTAAQLATPTLRSVIDELIVGRSRTPLTLGIEVAPPRVAAKLRASVGLEPRDGLLIRGVVAGSPAERAGIRSGDLIVSVGGVDLVSTEQLFAVLSDHDEAQLLAVGLVRGADESTLDVSFAAATSADSPADAPAEDIVDGEQP